MERPPRMQPPLCQSDDDPDAVWGVNMEACITPYSEHDHKVAGSGLAPWPARLSSPSPRLADFGYSNEMFEKDTVTWRQRVDHYWSLLSPKISSDTLRNITNMKADLGSLAAALKDKNVWVTNIVPKDGPNTIKSVHNRDLIGTTHDWCEAFSIYPKTYDLLHAWTVFSDAESGEDLLLKIDRIPRPTGFFIIRDKQHVIEFVTALHRKAVRSIDSTSDPERDNNEIVFVVLKKLWKHQRYRIDSRVCNTFSVCL